AETAEHVGDLPCRRPCQPGGGGLAGGGIESHVQRPLPAEPEAARPLELRRRNAEVEEDAVCAPRDAALCGGGPDAREGAVADLEARVVAEALPRRGHRFRVLVEGEKAPVRPQPLEDGRTVSAAPERAVDVDAAPAGIEGEEDLVQEDRRVPVFIQLRSR